MRRLACLVVLFTLVVSLGLPLAPAQACVGARALSMGGAFTGLADDVSATYWNPAALVELEAPAATYMRSVNNRDSVNYQDYVAYAAPLDDESAFGISYIAYKLMPTIGMYEASLSWDQNKYWLSYGRRVSDDTSLGANLKLVDDDFDYTYQGTPLPISGDTDMSFDLAVYHHASENVTIGLLIQDVNEPETSLTAGDEDVPLFRWVRNYRPGVAVRGKDGLTFAAEVYDATDEFDRAFRFGVEKKFEEQEYALRAGWYGNADALTLGAGTWDDDWAFDVAFLSGDLGDTWLASVTKEFR